ncbi:MAG: hypothetical protein Q4D42_06080 [Eubacteriales bacterium]|nr:hypothetical protein [Eubacteriales bacterium]
MKWITIIGGADGPTAVMVSSGLTGADAIPALLFLAASIGVMVLVRWMYGRYRDRQR